MPDFSHLAKADLDPSKRVDYPLDALDGDMVLQVVSATEANTKYTNARLRDHGRNKARARKVAAGRTDAAVLAEDLVEDIAAYAKFVVLGWRNVVDAAGKPVPFNEENCREFLDKIPRHVFRDLRDFCKNPYNFTDLPEEVEIVAKNSPSV